MTVSSATNEATFPGNGVAQIFPLPFRFFNNGDIIAQLVDESTGAASTLSLNTDYTLSGAGDPEVDGNATGVLTMLSPVAVGFSLFVRREIPLTQPTDIINQGRFFPEIHETVFDRLLMQIQQGIGSLGKALRVAPSEPNPAFLPLIKDRANRLLSFDSNGNPIAVAPASGDASELAIDLANSTNPTKGAALVGYRGRDVADRLQDEISVRDFGAKGDGVTDDTAAFVAARQVSGLVWVPDGEYYVDGTQLDLGALDGSPDAVLLYKTGQRVALSRVANAESLDQLYWQEIEAAPGSTLNRNATPQALGICEGVVYMTQNVSSPSGTWAADSVVRVSSFPLSRASTDLVDITSSGGGAATAVVDLVGLGHGPGASVIRENGKLYLYSTLSSPTGQAPVDGPNCNYGTGYTKTEWKGAATSQVDVQSFRGLSGVYSAEVCVSADGRYVVLAGYKFQPVVRDSASYYGSIPYITVFDRAAVESAGDPSGVAPLHSFPVPYIQSLGDAIGALSGVACDGEFIYILNGGAQVVGARSLIVMTLSGAVVKSMQVSGFAGIQPELFRKGAGGKQAFAFEIEGLAFHDDTLMMLSKFNVCTPSTVVSWQGKNFIPVAASTGVSPASFGLWARTEAPAAGAWNSATAYAAPSGLVYHKYLTALAPLGRHDRPHGVADGLYLDAQAPGYSGVYGGDAGLSVYGHLFIGQYDRNTETTWPMFEYRSSGLGRLFDCDQVRGGSYDPSSYFGRLSYDYDVGTILSAGPSVGTGATLSLSNARDTSIGDRYGVIFAQGGRAMLWGVNNLSYKNFVPTTDGTLSLGTGANPWSQVYAASTTISTSDARLKTDVRALTESELAAAQALAAEVGVYQWRTAIADKGESARLHIGMTVQRAIEIMEQHGLDPLRYGFICHDTWDEQTEQVDTWEDEYDEAGNLVREAGSVVAQAYLPAGDRYAFRMDELMAFIARGQAARLDAMEARLAALEAG